MNDISIPHPEPFAVPPAAPAHVARWESEIPLLVLVVLVSLGVWTMLTVSIIGIAYALFIAAFFFVAHLGFIAYLRGSAVKLGPDQLPELHARVVAISQRLGLERPPEAYLMQADGALNALATKLFRSQFIVLFSDLLAACSDDQQAADFVIAHEIGHLRAGHLQLRWMLLPGLIFPFLGSAYSRACEYTADRYGRAGVDDARAAVRGMTVLAAGPQFAKRVNLQAFTAQRRDMDTVMMTLGRWLATHPPIADRIAQLDASVAAPYSASAVPVLGAVALIGAAVMTPVFIIIAGVALWTSAAKMMGMPDLSAAAADPAAATAATETWSETDEEEEEAEPWPVADVAAARTQALGDLRRLQAVAVDYQVRTRTLPADASELYVLDRLAHPAGDEPRDPFDGERYGYEAFEDGSFHVWSTGAERPELANELDMLWEPAGAAEGAPSASGT